MTRFDATIPDERKSLVADAIRAHRDRGSPFLTIEIDRDESSEDDSSESESGDEDDPAPWVQYANGVLNLDCTDAELERCKALLETFPSFTIDSITRPEDAEGVNVRIIARVDEERLSSFIEHLFLDVYECPEDYRAWVAEV